MTRFEPARGLDTTVARTILGPAVERLKVALRDEVRDRAPDGKVWMCVSPDTPVTGWGVEAVARRHHVGPLVRITTASGRSVALTPEHPVLTDRGWRQAGALDLSQCMVQVRDVPAASTPQIQDRPAAIGQVVDAAMQSSPVEVWSVGMGVDLHRNRTDCEVEVVRADRALTLKLDPGLGKSVRQHLFVDAHALRQGPGLSARLGCEARLGHGLACPVPSQFAQMGGTLLLDDQGLMFNADASGGTPASKGDAFEAKGVSRGRLRATVAGGKVTLRRPVAVVPSDVFHRERQATYSVATGEGGGQLGLRLRSLSVALRALTGGEQLATVTQSSSHGLCASADDGSDLGRRLAPFVALDHIVNIKRYHWSGHVYDLSTNRSWYLADGLIVHNSASDERVRPTHVHADSQEIPANLRYVLEVPGRRGEPSGQTELGRRPRDQALSAANAVNCRCDSVPVPDAVARQVRTGPTVVAGTRVRAEVSCVYHRVVESEYPDDGDSGGRWFGSAINAVAARASSVARQT